MRRFTGTGVAMITPFTKDEKIDWNALEKIIEHLIAGKVEYIVSLGTTGESMVLSKEEKKQVWDFTRKKINRRIGLVAGVGGNNTAEVIHQIKEFDAGGFDAILSVNPYYNKPIQEGIYQHFMKIAEASTLPIILYNVPSRTGMNISAETTLRLAKANEKIIAIKEASGNFTQCMQIIENKPEDFVVISGDDAITVPMISVGIEGVISVAGNAFPKDFSEMVRLALKGSFSEAKKLHYKLFDIMELCFAEGSPACVKAFMHQLNLCENVVRLPNVPVSKNTYDRIESAAQKLK
jgi:4-hydroxy-tetrahydrodipicolinate synthase